MEHNRMYFRNRKKEFVINTQKTYMSFKGHPAILTI